MTVQDLPGELVHTGDVWNIGLEVVAVYSIEEFKLHYFSYIHKQVYTHSTPKNSITMANTYIVTELTHCTPEQHHTGPPSKLQFSGFSIEFSISHCPDKQGLCVGRLFH